MDLTPLRAAFAAKGSVLVAFSGGVDSAVLAKVASDVLGPRALAVIVDSESYARSERAAAEAFARDLGIAYKVAEASELADPGYAANPPDRCAFCRRGLADTLLPLARVLGLAHVAAGTNTDDVAQKRYGDAALAAAGVWQPYVELGWTKADVRAAARALGLAVADKPSMACLSSRIPTGEAITAAKLRRVEAAEAWIAARGFRQVRVRSTGDAARVEVLPEEVPRLKALETDLRSALLALGFVTVEVDPHGYGGGLRMLTTGR